MRIRFSKSSYVTSAISPLPTEGNYFRLIFVLDKSTLTVTYLLAVLMLQDTGLFISVVQGN